MVPSNQLQTMKRLGHCKIRGSLVSGSCLHNKQVATFDGSNWWHLVLVGSSPWLKRNTVSLMLLGRDAVYFQIRRQSRSGIKIFSFPLVVTSISDGYMFFCEPLVSPAPGWKRQTVVRCDAGVTGYIWASPWLQRDWFYCRAFIRFREEKTSNNEAESFLDFKGLK
jgi:hypothetical protein